ncbi:MULTISPECIES: AraC family transcriptional regulator [Micromonospora]|uniref:AraC family transcriptional regulator n=1 Tax=Micromonospora solifontis TaxID=2487138 RepID=A0ABX9WEP0_9ACTN|nr:MULTISPECIES: AraC family transcriptional regulator [Micromonospora]NES13941.1 helix-turn-helix transcriptional regulator [Micromonospora sp. PPF5-17B]NES37500.1 helix-turn-helix transcriptional regulator [Micromonospora solifontis]NES54041.1 helix-turn-helix transcriptional regulator [Micromonospora sp. PPF5-6]RNL98306.1 AraC family transcriptional regulator [Micromonospora solifontis]
MRTATPLLRHPDFRVTAVRCRDDHTGWSPPEQATGYGMVLTRRGGFRRAGRAGEEFVEPTIAYLTVPGEEERYAHPAGGDDCTAVHLSERLWRDLFADRPLPGVVHVDARVDLAHRLLLRAGADPEYAAAERLVRLLAAATGPAAGSVGHSRRLVERARAALRDDHPDAAGLLPLARSLGVSPYRLSREFQALVGVPLTRYRNRLRVGRALDRLEDGVDSLAALAAELGFADQAHLTRTVRAQLGHTPGQLRRLLG